MHISLLLGIGTFASVNALPIVNNFDYLNGKLLAQTQIQARDFALRNQAAAKRLIYKVADNTTISAGSCG